MEALEGGFIQSPTPKGRFPNDLYSGVDQQQGMAFRAGRIEFITLAFFNVHVFMAVEAAEGLEPKRFKPVFLDMSLGQSKVEIFFDGFATCGTPMFWGVLELFFESQVIIKTQPRSHPHGKSGRPVLEGGLINAPRVDGLLGQLIGHLECAMVLPEANPSKVNY